MFPSADAMYSPPPGSPPNETNTGEPSYAPPPGSPPTTNHTSNPAQPFPPGGEQYIVVGLGPNGSEIPITTEPPPPYTAKASDPLPSWIASPTQLQDITSSAPALPPTHLPLDPPPDFFSTPSPPRIRARSFAPFTIPARGHTLDGGFALLYADALRAHGIAPAHWARFLQDLQAVARLALQGRDLRGARPKTTGLAVGSTRGRVYDAAFVKSPLEQVQGLLEVYNGSAWERRKVRVTLRMQTDEGGRGGGYGLLVEAL